MAKNSKKELNMYHEIQAEDKNLYFTTVMINYILFLLEGISYVTKSNKLRMILLAFLGHQDDLEIEITPLCLLCFTLIWTVLKCYKFWEIIPHL